MQSLRLLKARYTSPPGRPGTHSAMLQLLCEDSSTSARYSFIQPSELRQRGVNEIVKASKEKAAREFDSIESLTF